MTAAEGEERPLDIATMRESANRLLSVEKAPPRLEDLDTVTSLLRGHVELLVPEIRERLDQLPSDDAPGQVARIGVEEAWRRLHTPPGFGPVAAYAQAQRLARSVNSLCDHYENLRCTSH
ncbi:DUF6415 family natural product biosynthesis protein [Streptomyces sp.]|uniref:DUF6415 family natural product biosynthesis protein n=1 Tax=Streptomyces sp. TaxID=1931 RepID=UPI002D79CCBB|nr:DUF6415 family natural product biosynthesis protein [Streptomyces sp.]HET6354842.1 DUF6415 family natural product biosynthesis protein [Streptomyces sp.]